MQSRKLGIRIGSLLQAWEEERAVLRDGDPNTSKEKQKDNDDGQRGTGIGAATKRLRNYRIVIHTSPFLRCVQTAIAASAGISLVSGTRVAQHAKDYDAGASSTEHSHSIQTRLRPSLLRLDAFLGEWLTPDYFEQITPPPGSVMMLTSAKGELLRRGEAIEMAAANLPKPSLGNFPGGWSSPTSSAANSEQEDEAPPLERMTAMAQALPSATTRSSSYDYTNMAPIQGRPVVSKISTAMPQGYEGYVPPMPTYAVAPSDPIPPGYVAHARDACVEIDYQWDSMREPYNWGTGGEYGEEWSSMHQRFRTGLEKLVEWYRSAESPTELNPSREKSPSATAEEDDTETVVVLVTHGAGCNALIGALTNRPALMDVGMSSLTMAVRKDDTPTSGSMDLAAQYEVKLVASNDHIRTDSNHPFQPHPSPKTLAGNLSWQRHRSSGSSPSTSPRPSFSLGESTIRDFRRTTPSHSASASRSSARLWSSVSASDSADDLIPNFEDPKPAASHPAETEEPSDTRRTDTADPARPNYGLWSGPANREPPSKRRWTVTNQSSSPS
jgi:broad specificity phosphatase PhoE